VSEVPCVTSDAPSKRFIMTNGTYVGDVKVVLSAGSIIGGQEEEGQGRRVMRARGTHQRQPLEHQSIAEMKFD
jgi:hypothetical protein